MGKRSTTQSIWRSGGGDSTRTTINGSMYMIAPFYIANAAASGNVVATSSNANAVVLPANAVVDTVVINSAGAGTLNLGFTPLVGLTGPGQSPTLGTPVAAGFLAGANAAAVASTTVGATGAGSKLGLTANATNLVVVTSASNANATGSVSGYIGYFVADDGQQSD